MKQYKFYQYKVVRIIPLYIVVLIIALINFQTYISYNVVTYS